MNKVAEWLYNKPTIRLQFESEPICYNSVTIIMRNTNYVSMKRIKIDHFKYIDDDEFINILNQMYEELKRRIMK